jgi:putative phosphoesterase
MTHRLATISDVHADADALRDALGAIEALGCNEVVCAGDVVGYGSEPDDVIALLRANGIATVRGNHDRWLVSHVLLGRSTPEDESLRDRRSFEFLAKLPTSLSFTREEIRIAVVHGSTAADDMAGVMLHDVDRVRCQALLDQAGADVLVVGHTHHAGVIRVGASGEIVNPGALLRTVPPGYTVAGPGTLAVLELPSKVFRVYDARTGYEVETPVRVLGEPFMSG